MRTHTCRSSLGRVGLPALLALAACSTDSILQVDRPDIIPPTALGGALGATALYNGAIGDMAYAQGTFSGLMLGAGLFSDEFQFGGTPPEVRQFDLGGLLRENSFSQVIYLNLHRGRISAAKAAAALLKVDASDKRVAETLALQALATIWIGEHYCSGTPLSDYGPPIVYGNPLSTADVFNQALQLLTSANAQGDARIANFIAVLKGRALLDNAKFPEAALAVASVPTDYKYDFLYSAASDRTQNNMKSFIYDTDYMSVSDHEGTNGLDFASANDPRVPVELSQDTPTGVSRFDGKTPMYRFTRYNSFDAPITNASGVEARLIEAEAALNAGNPALWLQKLNEARAPWSLPDLTDPGTPPARVDLMFRERAFAMFATAHRVGDLRRLVRQYGRPVTSVFPTGPYHKDNLTRGNQGSIIIPQTEDNNPNYHPTDCDPLKS